VDTLSMPAIGSRMLALSARLPSMTVAVSGRLAAFSRERVNPTTSWLSATNCSTRWVPTKPVTPVTKYSMHQVW
jgi:hypothetical protein